MLRGAQLHRLAAVGQSLTSLTSVWQRRALVLRPTTRLFSEAPPGRSAAEEDREELERERRLREQFAQKIQQGVPHASGGSGAGPWPSSSSTTGSPFGNNGGGFGGMRVTSERTPMQQLFRMSFFLFAILALMSLGSLADRNSPAYTMQGLPWWELPISSASYFILLRALCSHKDQRRIKEEFEEASRQNVRLTFDQFMASRYPNLFDGYHTSQGEAVAAVAAVLATATDLKFAQSVARAAGRAKDTRASVDSIVDALRRDYPQLFS